MVLALTLNSVAHFRVLDHKGIRNVKSTKLHRFIIQFLQRDEDCFISDVKTLAMSPLPPLMGPYTNPNTD